MRPLLRGRPGLVILVIDFIGGRYLSIRRRDGGLVITLLDPVYRHPEMQMSGEEWNELVTLITALKAAVDFQEGYDVKSAQT